MSNPFLVSAKSMTESQFAWAMKSGFLWEHPENASNRNHAHDIYVSLKHFWQWSPPYVDANSGELIPGRYEAID